MQFKKMAAVVSSALAVSAGVHAQDAVQWRVEDGGNGHWYDALPNASGRTWNFARTEAEMLGAHLATISSAAEFEWCKATFLHRIEIWTDNSWGPFLGGVQSIDSKSATQGWHWIDGSEWYADWGVSNCGADDSCGDQQVLAFGRCVTGGTISFNDEFPTDPPVGSKCTAFSGRSALIEWSYDCNSDGIVDYGQIRAGELEDVNANNIPDCCEQGASCAPCPGDIDQSGSVNAVDLAAVLTVWGSDGGKYPRADTNNDGVVNGADLATVLGLWGPCE